jgi:hypothetical protein
MIFECEATPCTLSVRRARVRLRIARGLNALQACVRTCLRIVVQSDPYLLHADGHFIRRLLNILLLARFDVFPASVERVRGVGSHCHVFRVRLVHTVLLGFCTRIHARITACSSSRPEFAGTCLSTRNPGLTLMHGTVVDSTRQFPVLRTTAAVIRLPDSHAGHS